MDKLQNIYNFILQNGYKGSYKDFKKEVLSKLSQEELENISGGVIENKIFNKILASTFAVLSLSGCMINNNTINAMKTNTPSYKSTTQGYITTCDEYIEKYILNSAYKKNKLFVTHDTSDREGPLSLWFEFEIDSEHSLCRIENITINNECYQTLSQIFECQAPCIKFENGIITLSENQDYNKQQMYLNFSNKFNFSRARKSFSTIGYRFVDFSTPIKYAKLSDEPIYANEFLPKKIDANKYFENAKRNMEHLNFVRKDNMDSLKNNKKIIDNIDNYLQDPSDENAALLIPKQKDFADNFKRIHPALFETLKNEGKTIHEFNEKLSKAMKNYITKNGYFSMNIRQNTLYDLFKNKTFKAKIDRYHDFNLEKFGLNNDRIFGHNAVKYGYLSKEKFKLADDTDFYGDIKIIFKKQNVINRCTFTGCDSLNNKNDVIPSSLLNASIYSFYPGFIDNNKLTDFIESKGQKDPPISWYLELQYHGELTIDDIDTIIVIYPEKLNPEFIDICKQYNIKLKDTEGNAITTPNSTINDLKKDNLLLDNISHNESAHINAANDDYYDNDYYDDGEDHDDDNNYNYHDITTVYKPIDNLVKRLPINIPLDNIFIDGQNKLSATYSENNLQNYFSTNLSSIYIPIPGSKKTKHTLNTLSAKNKAILYNNVLSNLRKNNISYTKIYNKFFLDNLNKMSYEELMHFSTPYFQKLIRNIFTKNSSWQLKNINSLHIHNFTDLNFDSIDLLCNNIKRMIPVHLYIDDHDIDEFNNSDSTYYKNFYKLISKLNDYNLVNNKDLGNICLEASEGINERLTIHCDRNRSNIINQLSIIKKEFPKLKIEITS